MKTSGVWSNPHKVVVAWIFTLHLPRFFSRPLHLAFCPSRLTCSNPLTEASSPLGLAEMTASRKLQNEGRKFCPSVLPARRQFALRAHVHWSHRLLQSRSYRKLWTTQCGDRSQVFWRLAGTCRHLEPFSHDLIYSWDEKSGCQWIKSLLTQYATEKKCLAKGRNGLCQSSPKHNCSTLCMSSHLTTTAVIAQLNISVYSIYFLRRKCCGRVRGIAIAVPGVSSPKGILQWANLI